jgi:transposase
MLTRLFCEIDDFCQSFLPHWEAHVLEPSSERPKRNRPCGLSLSEVMTVWVHYHQSGYHTFKWYYQRHVQVHLKSAFPRLPSYQRVIERIPDALVALTLFMQSRCEASRGIAFIDSTPLRVCENLRIPRHKTFADTAGRGKSSTGWFYGFKLHLVVNDQGGIVSFALTPGNVDDRKPVPTLMKSVVGKVFGDAGYVSRVLTAQMVAQGIEWITSLKKNMKQGVYSAFDRLLLRKRFLIETINDQLKNQSQIEHSRHRSLIHYIAHVIAGLIAYSYQAKKPSLNLNIAALPTLS